MLKKIIVANVFFGYGAAPVEVFLILVRFSIFVRPIFSCLNYYEKNYIKKYVFLSYTEYVLFLMRKSLVYKNKVIRGLDFFC